MCVSVLASLFWNVVDQSVAFFYFPFCARYFLVFSEKIKLSPVGWFQTFFSWHANDCWCTSAENNKTLYHQPSWWHLKDTWKAILFFFFFFRACVFTIAIPHLSDPIWKWGTLPKWNFQIEMEGPILKIQKFLLSETCRMKHSTWGVSPCPLCSKLPPPFFFFCTPPFQIGDVGINPNPTLAPDAFEERRVMSFWWAFF